MDKASKEAEEPPPTQFELAGLYDDEFSTRRRQKGQE